ncbi:hypothetical protein [Psychromonas sp. SP041]|uniref:hypothetical protein n=1 Tax=Psychromonas sp. SP041 TaxID=1365007 RepID=UPI0004163CD9|nr:hypothetical protein [Psychromonas sp. SP041]
MTDGVNAVQSDIDDHPDIEVRDGVLKVNGCLFLRQKGVAQQQFDYFLGNKKIPDESVNNFKCNIKHNLSLANEVGFKYLHIIYPAKPCVYKESFKDIGVDINSIVTSEHLMPSVIYGESITRHFYFDDTHHNDQGLYEIIKQGLVAIGEDISKLVPIYKQMTRQGGLGKMYGSEPHMSEHLEYFEGHTKGVIQRFSLAEYLAGNSGHIDFNFNGNAIIKKRIVLFGDSFFRNSLDIFSEIFEEVIYFRNPYIFTDIVKVLTPDIVLTGNAERYLVDVPNSALPKPYFLNFFGEKFRSVDIPFNTKNMFSMLFSGRNDKEFLAWRSINLLTITREKQLDPLKITLDDFKTEKDFYFCYQLAVFWESKDINYSFHLIKLALKIRPNGPVLKKKHDEYKAILDTNKFKNLLGNSTVGNKKPIIVNWLNTDSLQKLVSLYPDININVLKGNLKEIIHTDNTAMFIKQLSRGYLELKCPIHNKIAKCQHSLAFNNSNALYFKGDEPFYLLQDEFSIDAFYYPNSSVVILLNGSFNYKVKINHLTSQLNENKEKLNKYYANPTHSWGIYCFHKSPYHYYYFQVSSFLPLLEKEKNLNNVIVYSLKGSSYLDLSRVSNKISKDIMLDSPFTIEEQLNSNSFYIKFGEHTNKIKLEQFIACDELLNNYLITEIYNNKKINRIKESKSQSYILWLGIDSGKRTWVEQVDSYKELIRELILAGLSVTVIIDGWTNAKGLGENISLYSGDKILADKLISYFVNTEVVFIDLIGEYAEIKAKIALDVDFFITSHSTASIWVSRFAGKNGVTHISNAARATAISAHVHPKAVLIPENCINDIHSESPSSTFHVSYSLSTENFMKITFPLALEAFSRKV